MNTKLEIDSFPRDYNCSYIGEYVSAYNFGTTTVKTGKIPNKLLWYLIYNQSGPGLNKWGIKTGMDDLNCFYSGLSEYGYDLYKDNVERLNNILANWKLQHIPINVWLKKEQKNMVNRNYELITSYRNITKNFSWDETFDLDLKNGVLIIYLSNNKLTKTLLENRSKQLIEQLNKQMGSDLISSIEVR